MTCGARSLEGDTYYLGQDGVQLPALQTKQIWGCETSSNFTDIHATATMSESIKVMTGFGTALFLVRSSVM
jgi:hypothetical protein